MPLQVKDAGNNTVTVSSLPARSVTQVAAAQQIKDGAGYLNAYTFYNPNNQDIYINFYNALDTNVTPGTTPIAYQDRVQAMGTARLNVGYLEFTTGISVGCSVNANGTTDPTTPLEWSAAYV